MSVHDKSGQRAATTVMTGKSRTLIRAREVSPGQVVFTVKQTSPDVDSSLALGRAVLD